MSDTRLSIFQIVNEFSRLTEIDLIEQFVNGVRKFAASIVNLEPLKNELCTFKEIRGKMVIENEFLRKYFSKTCKKEHLWKQTKLSVFIDAVLVFLLLNLNIFHTSFKCIYC